MAQLIKSNPKRILVVHSHFFMGPFTKKTSFSGSKTTKAKLKLTRISIKYLPADQGLVKCHEDIGDLDFNKKPPMPSSTLPRTKVFKTNQCCKRPKLSNQYFEGPKYIRTKLQRAKIIKSILQLTKIIKSMLQKTKDINITKKKTKFSTQRMFSICCEYVVAA